MTDRNSNSRIAAACLIALGAVAVGCTKPEEAAQPDTSLPVESSAVSPPADSGTALDIAFSSDPDPVRSGDNTLMVTVRQPDGTAVNDATVSARFYMPAMPSMNMPEMHSDFAFSPQGDGRYEASGRLVMGGTWNVTVNVQPPAGAAETRNFSVIAN